MRPMLAMAMAMAVVMACGVLTADAMRSAGTDSLDWQTCGDLGAECAALPVPLDWARPGGDRITVAVSRLTAADPARRIGTLFFNPGGPGGAATSYVRDFASTAFPADLLDRFDIVGVDPRGIGDSVPAIACEQPTADPNATQFPRTPAEFDQLVAYNRDVAEGCRRATGPLIDHVDTVSTARDFEAVRIALGDKQVSWLGVSYGTLLGATYAHLYPGRVRAAVLDGAVDHTVGSRELAVDEARTTEDVFGRFADWCQSDQTCALHGRDVAAEYRALLDRAPLPAAGFPDGATAAQIGYATYGKLTFPSEWSELAKDIDDAATDAAAFAATGTSSAAYRVITCHDLPTAYVDYEELAARQREVLALAPTTRGYVEGWDIQTGCLGWPIPPANPWARTTGRGKSVLVVGGTHDPSTPHEWAVKMSSQLRGSTLLTWDGVGHTGYFNDPDTQRREVDYLISGRR
jgi:pimeloyl-ACP methyl ester carboxylesterase